MSDKFHKATQDWYDRAIDALGEEIKTNKCRIIIDRGDEEEDDEFVLVSKDGIPMLRGESLSRIVFDLGGMDN